MPDGSALHRRTVFIVDDDASVRDSLSLLLSLRGYPTAVFASAESSCGSCGPTGRAACSPTSACPA
jgi:FixJ family two-component response regulator